MADKTDPFTGSAGALARLIRFFTSTTDRFRPRTASYRPEKHYMRGSGPKSKRPKPGDKHTPSAT